MLITDIDTNMISQDVKDIIDLENTLYASIPIQPSPTIYIVSDEDVFNSFVNYAYNLPNYFVNICVQKPTFIRINSVENVPHGCRHFNVQKILEANKNSYPDTIDAIMIHYI